MKRDGAGWDDHPAAGFESALVRIALAIEMQRYLWMSAEVRKHVNDRVGAKLQG